MACIPIHLLPDNFLNAAQMTITLATRNVVARAREIINNHPLLEDAIANVGRSLCPTTMSQLAGRKLPGIRCQRTSSRRW